MESLTGAISNCAVSNITARLTLCSRRSRERYARATTRAKKDWGVVRWVRNASLTGHCVLIRQPRIGRKDRSSQGVPRRSKYRRKNTQRSHEPWLLIASASLQHEGPRQLVKLYQTRMQIEENVRDTKSVAYGLGIAKGRQTPSMRAANLLLIAALARFVLRLIGCGA